MAGNLNPESENKSTEATSFENANEFYSKLTEEDIPGASLNGKDPKQMTVKQLKFWLSCRGAKISGKKDELVSRVNNYNAIPELRDKIVDPDPDKSFTKSKLEQVLANKSTSNEATNDNFSAPFPTSDSDFSDDLTALPSFNPGDLYNLAKNSGKSLQKYRHLCVVDKPVDKGFFMKNLVHDLQTCHKENTVYVRALCWASMSKSVEYQVKLMVNSYGNEPKVEYATCDKKCPASKSGCCCHVMATMWTLDEYCRLNLTRVPSIKSKTSKPQAWGKPNKKRKVIHKPVMETKLARPKHVSVVANINKRQGIVSTLFDPRPLEKRCIDVDGLKQMSKKLQDSKSNIPYAKVLPCTVDDIQVTNTIVGVVARGSLLEMHLKGDQIQSPPSAILTASNVNNTCGSSFPDLPLKCIEKKPVDEDNHKELKLAVHVTLHDSHEIFRHTLGQSKNVLWKKERRFRLTASNFGKIINRKCEYTDSFIQSICNPVDISTNPWVRYGNENEEKVAKLYTESMRHEGKVVQLYNVGLCVNPTLPHLGASLDRGVYDPSVENKYGGLEVKTCPKAGNLGLSIQEAIDHKEFKSSFFLQKKDGDISLKRSHNYYYQVQGQLALTALPWIDFVAYSGLGTIYKERVHLDKPLWESTILPKLNLFYFCNQNSFQ